MFEEAWYWLNLNGFRKLKFEVEHRNKQLEAENLTLGGLSRQRELLTQSHSKTSTQPTTDRPKGDFRAFGD